MKEIFSFNSGWKFIKDKQLYNNIIDDYFDMFSNDAKTGVAAGPKGNDCCDDLWENVTLPHDWQIYDLPNSNAKSVQGYKSCAKVWYRKHFTLPDYAYEKRVFLKFDSIAIHSEIYVNAIKVLEMNSGSTEIFVEITDFIEQKRQITVSVLADNTIKEGWWYEGGGIIGNAYLIICENSFIKNHSVFVCPEKIGNEWKLDISCECEINDSDLYVELNVPLLNISRKIQANAFIKASFDISSPILWSCENPYLYEIFVNLYHGNELIDTEKINTGFRECIFDSEKGFFLNGKSMKIKGVCLHNDHAGVGCAIVYGLHEYRLKKLKSMGCNAIRTSHNPYPPEFYELCDKMGFLVMNEIRHFSSTRECLSMLESFIKRDRNHPSVIMWSIFNEEPLQCTKIGQKMADKMKKLIKSLDPSRPVTGGMNGPLEQEGVINTVDIMGFNYLQYGYDIFHKAHPEIPVIGSETGSYLTSRGETKTDMKKGKRCSYARVMNENLYAWSDTPGGTWENIEKRPFVMGGFYWTGFDYRGESGLFPSVVSSFGAMDLCGFEKDNYFWHKILWNDKPDLYVSPFWYSKSETIDIICYSNCEKLKLYINGKLTKELENNKYNPKLITLAYQSGTLTVEGINNDITVCKKDYNTHKRATSLKCEIFKSNGIVIADFYALDSNSVFVPDADCKIHFHAENAEILGVGNGDNTRLEPDKSDTVKLYNGCCQLILKPAGKSVKITAESDCLEKYIATVKIGDCPEQKKEINGEKGKIPVSSWRMSDISKNYPSENIADLMYAWIPTTIGYGNNLLFSGKKGYAVTAGTFTVPESDKKLVFEEITGGFDLYIDHKQILSEKYGIHKNITIELNDSKKGKSAIVTIVFRLDGRDCGISGNTYIE